MKKLGKIISVAIVAMLSVVLCVVCSACGGAKGPYTVNLGSQSLGGWDYCPISMNAFGDTAGVGMMNIEDWGNKKLERTKSEDGTEKCIGAGCVWSLSLSLDVEANNTTYGYALKINAHIKGDGQAYSNEGDFYYIFYGACEKVDGGYKLAQPTYAEAALTGNFTRNTDGSDFADYIPSAPWSIKSTDADGCEAQQAVKSKVVPSYMCTTIFGGATVKVSGSSIDSIVDIVTPED